MPEYVWRLTKVKRDNQRQIQLECPQCKLVADVDEDQAMGLVSVDCPECPLHEFVDVTRIEWF